MSWDKIPPTKEELSWMSEPPSEDVPEISQTEAAIRGAAQGATMGFADEATGAAETALGAVKGDVPLSREDLLKAYRESRDKTRQLYSQAEEAHPSTYLAGEVVGGVSTALIPGTQAASLGKAAALGAGLGGLSGLGKTEELDSQAVQDVATGAAFGGAGGAAGYGIGKGIQSGMSKLSSMSSKASDQLAANAAGIKGVVAKELSPEQIRAQGRVLKDEGVVGWFTGPEEIASKGEQLAESAGKRIGQTVDTLDTLGAKAYNPEEVVGNVLQKSRVASEGQGKLKQLLDMIRESKSPDANDFVGNDPRISFREAQNLKGKLGTEAFGKGGTVESKEVSRAVGGVVDEAYLDAAEKAAREAGDSELVNTLLQARKQYRAGTLASEGGERLAKMEGGKTPKLSVQGLMNTVVTPGASTLSKGLEAASSGLAKSAGFIGKTTPLGMSLGTSTQRAVTNPEKHNTYSNLAGMDNDQVAELSERLRQQGAEEYSRVLDKALAGDKQSRDAMLFSLSQQPSFRKIVNPQE